MKKLIQVTPEGREGIFIPDKESLKAWIKSNNFKEIHNFIPSGMFIIGADHEVDSVLDDIDRAERIAILTKGHENMGHALSIITNGELECYDIGVITEKDLAINEPR